MPGHGRDTEVAPFRVYLYRAVDQSGQVIDIHASGRRDSDAACRFFQRALRATGVMPVKVITDRAPTYPRVLDEMRPAQLNVGCARCAGSRP